MAGKSNQTILKLILAGFAAISVISLLIYYFNSKTNPGIILNPGKIGSVLGIKDTLKNSSNRSAPESETKSSPIHTFYNPIPTGLGVQEIKTILKENADCTSPITIIDSIVFSLNSPKGCGNIVEIKDNKPDDTLYFENEHNTVWYKFIAKEYGNLTFDIIPLNQNDDYDFMLYQYNGKDFSSKVIGKEVKPIRTCISRNDKKLKSMTGLSLDESSKKYIHSGLGASYVKYVRVKKGEVFYLVVDNIHNGKGHSIRFHYKTFAPGEMYVGQSLSFSTIKFIDSDYKFKKGSEKGLDSLYQFLRKNPAIKIEIDGHVNHSGRATLAPPRAGEQYNDLQLSQKRAEAIYDFLVHKGIDSKRLVGIGYGSTRMLKPNAKTREEMVMNIRAEIIILSLDYKKDMEQ